jgi:autotransporter-associated beta strand protein
MANYARNNTSGLAWTNTAAWTPNTGAPITAADAAQFTSVITLASSTTAANATVGQIEVIGPQAAVTIATSAGQTITLSPAASFSSIGIKYTGTTGSNLTIASLLALASSQTWQVTSGRTLTVSGVVSGATSSLTKSDAGTLAFTTAANTFGGGGGQTFTAAAGLTTAAVANSLGSALNSVVVSNGGAIRFAATPAQTAFSVAGSGNALQAGAIFFNSSGGFASGKTITLSGASPTIGLLTTAPSAGVIAGGSSSGDVTFNLTGSPSSNSDTLTSTQTFSVAAGSYLVLQGVNPVGGAQAAAEFSLATTDAGPFGAVGNEVRIDSRVALINRGATGDVVLSRNYLFNGEASSALTGLYSLRPYGTQGTGTFVLEGTVKGTAGNWVKTSLNGAGALTTIQLGSANGGKLDGTWNLRSFNAAQTIYFHPNLDISTWTGAIWAFNVDYGVAPTGPATYEAGADIDNVSGAALTLAHSGYTLSGGTVTFTGTNDLSTGPNNITTTGGTTFSTSTAGKRLTIPGSIAGSATLAKAGAGTLRLSGNNTGFSAFSHQAGVLELNSNGSAGPVGATFTFFATGTTIDSTTGATLTAAGTVNIGASAGGFTWNGTNNLTFPGTVTHGGSRTVTFVNGATGILTFAGPLSATTLTYLWNVGGGVAGAKNVLYFANTNASLATTGQVTAGYLRAGNATSLGSESVAGSVTWTVSSGAAIELINGITVSAKKNFNGVGTGPNLDGALRSVSGANNKWQGQISISTATGARIQVDAGTFTLDPTGSPAYVGIDAPAGTNTTPITFTALPNATLNQDRILAAGFSTVTIGNGSGTVVLSKANLHSGAMTCSAGTTKLTNVAAVGAGAGNSVTVTAGATMESAVKAIFPATLTLGSTSTPAIFKISA